MPSALPWVYPCRYAFFSRSSTWLHVCSSCCCQGGEGQHVGDRRGEVDVVAFDKAIVDAVMVGKVIVCAVVFAVVAIGEVIVCAVAFDVVVIGMVAIGVGVIGMEVGIEVGIEVGTGIGSSLFTLIDAAPVVMPLISFLICWMMHSTMSRRAMVLGAAH